MSGSILIWFIFSWLRSRGALRDPDARRSALVTLFALASPSSTEFDGRFALTVFRSLSLLDFARRDPHYVDGVRDDMNGSAADSP